MIVFDPIKDAANIAKHGLSLSVANRIVLDDAIVVIDKRHDYGEVRYNAYAELDGRFLALTFTYRDETIRAISLRPCHLKEHRRILRAVATGEI